MKKVLSFLILFLTVTVLGTSAQKSRENYYLLGPQSDGPAQKDGNNNDIKKVDFFNTALKLQPVEGSNSKYYIEIPALYPYESGTKLDENCYLNYGLVVKNGFQGFAQESNIGSLDNYLKERNLLTVKDYLSSLHLLAFDDYFNNNSHSVEIKYDIYNFPAVGFFYDFNLDGIEFEFGREGLSDSNYKNSNDAFIKFIRLSFYSKWHHWAIIDNNNPDYIEKLKKYSDSEIEELLKNYNYNNWVDGKQYFKAYDYLKAKYSDALLISFFEKLSALNKEYNELYVNFESEQKTEIANFESKNESATKEYNNKIDQYKKQFEQQAKDNFYNRFLNYFNNKGFSFYVAKESTINKAHTGQLSEYEALKQLIVPSTADDVDGNHYVFGKNRKSGSFTTYNNADPTKNRWEIRFNNIYSKKDITKNLEVLYGQLQPNTGGAYDAKTNDNTVLCRLTENGRDKLILDGSYRFTIDVATKTWSVEYQEKRVSYLMAYTTQWQNWKVNSVTTLYDEKDPTLKAYGKYHNKFTTPYTYMFREADGDGHKYCYDFMQNNDKSTGCEEYLKTMLKKDGVLVGDVYNKDYNVSDYASFVPFIGSVPYLISFGPSVNGSSTEIKYEESGAFKGCLVMEPGYGNNKCMWPQGGYMNVAQYSYSLANHGYVTINDGKQDKAMLQSILICQGAKILEKENGKFSTEGGALSSSEPLRMSYKPSLKAYSIEVPASTFHNGKFYFLGLDDYITTEIEKNSSSSISDFFKNIFKNIEKNNGKDKKILEAYDHNYAFYNTGKVDYPTVSNPNAQSYTLQEGLGKSWDDIKNYFKSLLTYENVDAERLNIFKDPDENYDGYYRINLYITSENEAHYTIEKIGYRFKGVSLMAGFANGRKTTSTDGKSYPLNDHELWGEEMTYVSEGIPHYELKISKKDATRWQDDQRFCFEALLEDGTKVLFGAPENTENSKSVFEKVVKLLQTLKEAVSGYDDRSLDNYSNCEVRTDDIAPDHIGVNNNQYVPNNGGADLGNIDEESCDLVFRFYPVYGKYGVYTITPLINKVSIIVNGNKETPLEQNPGSDVYAKNNFNSKGVIPMKPGDHFYFKASLELTEYNQVYFGQDINNSADQKAYSVRKANDASLYYFYPIVKGNRHYIIQGEVPDVPEGFDVTGYKVKDFYVFKLPQIDGYCATYKLVPILNGKAVADDDIEKDGMTKITFANTGVKEMPYIRTWSSSAYSYSYAEGSKNEGRVTAYRVDNVKFDGKQHADGTSNLKVYLRKVEDDDIHANEGLVLIPTLNYDNDGNIITNKYCEVDDENTVTVYLKPDDSKNDMPYELNYLQPSGEGKTVQFEEYDNAGKNVVARNYFLSTWHKTVDYPEYGGDDYVGFFRAITSKLGANKAYLSLSADVPEFDFNGRQIDVSGNKNYTFDELTDASSSSAKFGVMLVFDDIDDDSNTTGISGIKAASMNDDAYYSLSGERTTTPHAGKVYIHGGKKVVIVK